MNSTEQLVIPLLSRLVELTRSVTTLDDILAVNQYTQTDIKGQASIKKMSVKFGGGQPSPGLMFNLKFFAVKVSVADPVFF